ncbi:MAG: YggS family pyridoxal phosphate-dependent enzyme [Phycisphaerae bacterium]
MDVIARLRQVQERINVAANHARRKPEDIKLIAVSKYASTAQIQELIKSGHRDFGENRVQNLQIRSEEIRNWAASALSPGAEAAGPIHWHMIGHLQRNKAAAALEVCDLIHGVDSLRLAEHLNDLGQTRATAIPILMEVNTSGEAGKNGVPVPAAIHMVEQFETMAHVKLIGLMTMARQSDNPDDARRSFSMLREIFEELRFRKICGPHFRDLSMGMSGDFEVAIAEGATMVRVGSAIFGAHQESAMALES